MAILKGNLMALQTERKLASELKPGDIVIVNPGNPEQDIIVHSTEQVDGNWTAVYEEVMRYRHDIEVDVFKPKGNQ